jgi:hypothetical protein
MVKDKNVKKKTGTNNDLQSTTQKTKHLATWTQSKPGVNSTVINAMHLINLFVSVIDFITIWNRSYFPYNGKKDGRSITKIILCHEFNFHLIFKYLNIVKKIRVYGFF